MESETVATLFFPSCMSNAILNVNALEATQSLAGQQQGGCMVSKPTWTEDDEASLLHDCRNGTDAVDVFIAFELIWVVFFCLVAAATDLLL